MKLKEIELELIIFILKKYQKEHPSGQLSELLKKLWKELGEIRDRKYPCSTYKDRVHSFMRHE